MLYREIIAVCSQIPRKHINKLYRQNVELLNFKLAVPHVSSSLIRRMRAGHHTASPCYWHSAVFPFLHQGR